MRAILFFAAQTVLLVSLVAFSGCGSEEATTPDDEEIVVPRTSATPNDITVAVSEAGLDTLTRLLRETGLADSLRGEGPYTLFAPTDLAFTQLPGGSADGMSPAELAALLMYHIIPGRFETSSLAGSMEINTLHGGTVIFTVDGDAGVADAHGNPARLVTLDMNVDNGVVHIIDRVLMPGSAAGK